MRFCNEGILVYLYCVTIIINCSFFQGGCLLIFQDYQFMHSDKISLFNYLKSRYGPQDIALEQVLVVIHQNAITLNEARRFLFGKDSHLDWRTLSKEQFLNMAEESYQFVVDNRTKWIQQRKIYENSLLKFHNLYQQIAVKSQMILIMTKEQILKELRDQKTKTYAATINSLNAEEMNKLLSYLEAIVQFEKEAGRYNQANDYESNKLINKILHEISQKNHVRSINNSPQSKIRLISPDKIIKTRSGSLPKSHSMDLMSLQKESKKLTRNYSQRGSLFSNQRKNFIQEVRKQVKSDQNFKMFSRELSNNSELGSNRLVSIHLPKILKLSDEEISKQGIYKSLKKFANFDYVAQEKKIRDIIGISLGEDQEYMSAYFNKEMSVRLQKEEQQFQNKQERRKKILQSLTKKQHHHCRKYNPQEVQPYMRF